MDKESRQGPQPDDRESTIMGMSPAQFAGKLVGAALIVIVLVVVVSVASHA